MGGGAADHAEHERLAERVRLGDAAAEESLLAAFRVRVRVMMLARVRDRESAKDLTQEVLIAVLQALRAGRVRETGNLAAFVHGTARNILNSYYRARGQAPASVPIDDSHATGDAVGDFEQASRRRTVARALDALDGTDRTILRLTLLEGLKSGEVAQRLGLAVELVRTRKSRAVKQLSEKFGDPS